MFLQLSFLSLCTRLHGGVRLSLNEGKSLLWFSWCLSGETAKSLSECTISAGFLDGGPSSWGLVSSLAEMRLSLMRACEGLRLIQFVA